jgi:hypothetical protein
MTPVLLLIALAILATEGPPLFLRHVRPSLNGMTRCQEVFTLGVHP